MLIKVNSVVAVVIVLLPAAVVYGNTADKIRRQLLADLGLSRIPDIRQVN